MTVKDFLIEYNTSKGWDTSNVSSLVTTLFFGTRGTNVIWKNPDVELVTNYVKQDTVVSIAGTLIQYTNYTPYVDHYTPELTEVSKAIYNKILDDAFFVTREYYEGKVHYYERIG